MSEVRRLGTLSARAGRKHILLAAVGIASALVPQVASAAAASDPDADPPQAAVWGSYSGDHGRLLIVTRWPDDPSKPALYDSANDEFHHLELKGDQACTEGCATRLTFRRSGGRVVGVTVLRRGVSAVAKRDPLTFSALSFRSRGVELRGRIWAPSTPGRHPAVLLTGGTGKNLKDDFRIYPYLFVKAGFVVYAFDKAGAGSSGGDHGQDEEGIAPLAADAVAAVSALRQLPEVDSRRVGVLGISHGAWVSVEAARIDPRIAFVAAIVGGGVPLWRATLFEAHNGLVRKGYGPEDVRAGDELMSSVFQALRNGEAEKVPGLIRASASKRWFGDTPLAPFGTLPDDVIVSVARLRWSNELAYDPRLALESLKVPILAINGNKDPFVPGAQNLAGIRAAVGGRVTTQLLPGANHWQAIDDGRDFTYSPLLRPTLQHWLAGLWK